MCLICAETVLEHMSDADAARHFQEYAEFTRAIRNSGHFRGASRLKPAVSATTLRVRNCKVLITDGPFAETREQFCGYYLVEARDLDEAIRIAARIPGARYGSVELRPVADDPQTLAPGSDKPV
jgi:hypothetical protein